MRKFKKKLLKAFDNIIYELKDINMSLHAISPSLQTITSAFSAKGDSYPSNVLHTRDHSVK